MADQVFMATNATRTIAATTTPLRATLPGVARHARVMNGAASIAFIRFGVNDMDASVATSMPLGPGAVEVFRVPATAGYVSVVLASGSGPVYVTPGEGS
jgi:hypothetical protein